VSEPLRIGIAGLGTVGGGVVKLIEKARTVLAVRCGREIEIHAVSARDRSKDRGFDTSSYMWVDDPMELARLAEIDLVVELIGGSEGIALDLVNQAIANGKHVVTANKALIAHHGPAIAKAAEERGVTVAYEAAVAGGIPVVKGLREGLIANEITRLYGILNGTCNYILTDMEQSGRAFADVLAEAQELGYAEADPAFDVGGVDTAHKLTILACLAFGTDVPFEDVFVEGIEHITAEDIAFAGELGYRVKLLGIASREARGVAARVHPCLVKREAPIAEVNGVMNGVTVEGDPVGTTVFEGPGAGEGPTASAVAADIADIARGLNQNVYLTPAKDLDQSGLVPFQSLTGTYYVRLSVIDRPGVIASISKIMGDAGVSIESLLQRGRHPNEPVTVVVQTHEISESVMADVIRQIEALEAVVEKPCLIRIEAV
jgi:homoserine dehydrogenase